MGARLCALLVRFRRKCCRLVFRSGAYLWVSEKGDRRSTSIVPLSGRRCSGCQAARRIEKGRNSRAFRKRTLAHEEGRGAILGERSDDGPPRRRRGTAGLWANSARFYQASIEG